MVTTLKLSILSIQIKLSLCAAGMVVFRLGGLYQEERHTFDSKVKDSFSLGSILEVEIGYLSSAVKVFRGFIAMLGAEFGDVPTLVVTLMDVRRLMMLSGSVYMLHEVKNYSDAFRTLIGKYAKLCTPEIDATSDNLETPLSQTQNDYLFVTKELIGKGRADREFFALGDKVYFRKPAKVGQPVMTLQFGRELLALKNDEEYQDLEIAVIGYNPEKQSAVQGRAEVRRSKNMKRIFSSSPVLTLTDPAADTQKKADEKAEMTARRKGMEACSGCAVTIGLPELVPGRFVKVESLEKDYANHLYYIKHVTHEINGEQFRTTFEIGGWQ